MVSDVEIRMLWVVRKFQPLTYGDFWQKIYSRLRNDSGRAYPLWFHELFETVAGTSEYENVKTERLQTGFVTSTRGFEVFSALTSLIQKGIVRVTPRISNISQLSPMDIPNNSVLIVEPVALETLSIFDVSLTEFAYNPKKYRTLLAPIFDRPAENKKRYKRLFVAMPFQDNLGHIYSENIRLVAETLRVTCSRGDDFFNTNAVMQDVWSSIMHCELCIADCTGRNPNVFYEIGMAHTVGRKTILIAQSEDDIPFDIRHMRYIIYEDSEAGLAKFRETLTNTIKSELNL